MIETLVLHWVCMLAITADSWNVWNVRAGHINISNINYKARDKSHVAIATASMPYHETFITTEILETLSALDE